MTIFDEYIVDWLLEIVEAEVQGTARVADARNRAKGWVLVVVDASTRT